MANTNDRPQEGEYMYRVFNKEKLEKVIDAHVHWLAGDCNSCKDMRADLRDADLRGVDLRGKDLRKALLDGAIMDKHTCLAETDLSGASMSGAYLSGTDLRHTKLNEVNVNGAVFSQIIIDDNTDFKGTDLSHTEFSIAEKVMNAFPVRTVLAITVLVGIILLTLVPLTGMPNNILCAAIFALLPVEIFAITLSCRLFVPAMYHAMELTDVSRYMRIAAGKEIELDKLTTLLSLFKEFPKNGKDYRQLVTDEIGYYTGKGYFPEGCYDTEKGIVCFVVRDKKQAYIDDTTS